MSDPIGRFRTRVWMCLFGDCPFKGSNSPKTIFEGVNRRFKAKRVKNSNFHIFQTTASIATNFAQ